MPFKFKYVVSIPPLNVNSIGLALMDGFGAGFWIFGEAFWLPVAQITEKCKTTENRKY